MADSENDVEEVLMIVTKKCKFCGKDEKAAVNWWKCCAAHTSDKGPDVLCQWCCEFYHPDVKEHR